MPISRRPRADIVDIPDSLEVAGEGALPGGADEEIPPELEIELLQVPGRVAVPVFVQEFLCADPLFQGAAQVQGGGVEEGLVIVQVALAKGLPSQGHGGAEGFLHHFVGMGVGG